MSAELNSGMPMNVNRAEERMKYSPQEELARLTLLEKKFGNQHPLITTRSEKDEIMKTIAERISKVRESTPEWAELVAITGSESRIEQAEYLAEEAWNKRMRELVLRKYTGGNAKTDEVFTDSQARATNLRLSGGIGAEGLAFLNTQSPAAAGIRKLLGLEPPA